MEIKVDLFPFLTPSFFLYIILPFSFNTYA